MIRNVVICCTIMLAGMSFGVPKLNSQCNNGRCKSTGLPLNASATIDLNQFTRQSSQIAMAPPASSQQRVLLPTSNSQFIAANFTQQPVSNRSSSCGSSCGSGSYRRGLFRRR